jgi:hypothetical protein
VLFHENTTGGQSGSAGDASLSELTGDMIQERILAVVIASPMCGGGHRSRRAKQALTAMAQAMPGQVNPKMSAFEAAD